MRLTDDDLLSLCVGAVEDSAGWYNTELSEQRADAMDRYLGEPLGNEQEGRSHVRTREVFDTIQWILPSLIRLFADTDNLVSFEPVGPEDEEQARRETETVNHLFWQKNRGFYNLLTFLTDGLLSKTGILKAWWDDTKDEEREEYSGLTDMELAELLNDPEWQREVIEYELEEGGHHVVFKSTRDKGRVVIEPVPPEEFGIERQARSPYAKDATFCYHRARKTKSELIESGYDRKLVESLEASDVYSSEEQLARYHLDGEDRDFHAVHESMEQVWVTECYVRVDRDDDGIAELLKVTMATGSVAASGATLLDVEEVDRVPFSSFSPVILTHKFYGLSIADMVMDLQEIKTALLRGTLDAMYLANNPRTGINEAVNEDDMLVSRPGGLVRTKGNQPPAQHIFPIPSQPVPTETFGLLEYLDEARKSRTGAGDDVPALDKNSLANVNPSVAAIAYDAARQKIELIARIVAEVALVPLFRDIHELTSKHASRPLMMKLRGGWERIEPQEWRQRDDIKVQVGIGLASRERRLMTLEQLINKQMEIGSNGGMGQLIMPHQVYETLAKWTETLGLEPSMAWTDPRTIPPEPQQPDPQMQLIQLQAQIEGAKTQNERAKLQLDARKLVGEQQMKVAEFQLRREEMAARQQVEQLKQEIAAIKAGADNSNARMKALADAERAAKEAELKQAQMLLDDARERAKQALDWQKASLQSATTLTVEQLRQMGLHGEADAREQREAEEMESRNRERAESEMLKGQVMALTQALDEIQSRKPLTFERDGSGMVVKVGDRPVKRDAKGLIVSIG